MPPGSAAFLGMQLLSLLGVLALLVCNAAAGLASRLAGGLALTTAAVLGTVAQITSLDGLNMIHSFTFHIKNCILNLAQCTLGVNHIFCRSCCVSGARGCDSGRHCNNAADSIEAVRSVRTVGP